VGDLAPDRMPQGPPDASDFAPERVPIQPAATVMVLADRPDLHVLMLRRRAGSAFVGGMDVFPGGGVDSQDAHDEVEALCAGLDDAAASARLGLEAGGLAYWVAAVRETFEEAGVLFALGADGTRFDPAASGQAERLAAERRAVDAGERRLAEVVERAGLRLALEAMHYTARWITPEGPPRRYDTRFFVTAMPEGQTPVPDRREAVDSSWLRPAEVLDDFAAGRRVLLPPTVGMLRILASYAQSDEVIRAAAASEDAPDRAVRLASDGADWRVVLPDDAESGPASDAFEIQAWTRLRVRNQGTGGT